MLLRRVAEHLRQQQWTAVFLDFVVVVLGVFLGFQLNSWREARTDRLLEADYLTRLHEEVIEAENGVRTSVALKQNVQDSFKEVIDALRSESDATALSAQGCASIYFSHMFGEPFPSPPTMTELLSSGRLSVLRSDALREALVHQEQARRASEEFRNSYVYGRLVMPAEHPDLISLGGDFYTVSLLETDLFNRITDGMISCDLQGMRESAAFRNRFIDNASRHVEFYLAVGEQQKLLDAIHREIDAILAVDHGGES